MNIIEACKDDMLFRPYFRDDYETFASWRWVMRAANGIPIKSKEGKRFIRKVTGRDPAKLNPDGYSQVLCLTGRRSGKSAGLAAPLAAHAALFADTSRLRPGEIGMVACLSPTKGQSLLVKSYIEGLIHSSPVLKNEIVRSSQSLIELRSGIHIGILTGDWRTVRGYTLLGAIVDEIVFFNGGSGENIKVKSDTELIAALRPGLATTGGKLIGISSVHAKCGWAYDQWKKHYGNDKSSDTLIVHASSKTMNPTISQKIIDNALAEDYAKARAEYFSIWRDDVGLLVPREVVEALVVPDRDAVLPQQGVRYSAFADLSGGRSDDAAVAIAHREEKTVVIDSLVRWKAPFNPHYVVTQMCKELKRYGLRRVVGDNYSAEFVSRAFEAEGIHYMKADKPKAELYLNLLPLLTSGFIELPDNPALVNQIASLERRTRSGGRDIVDHPANGRDDLANVVAGVAEYVSQPVTYIGAF